MKRIIMASITAVVVIAVLAGALIPILDDATATHDTIHNEGYIRMSHITDQTDGTYTIKWDVDDPGVITVNDVDVPFTNIPITSIAFNSVFNSNWLLRASVSDSNGVVGSMQYYTTTGGVTSLSDLTMTCSAGTMSLSGNNGATTKTATYTDLYIPDVDGSYIMKSRDSPAHMLADSEFIGFGLTAVESALTPGTYISPGLGLSITGTIEDGATISIWRPVSNYTATFSDVALNKTESDRWVGVYDLDSITFDATITNTSDSTKTSETPVTYSYFLVPYEITAERIVHFTDGESAIFNAIPVIVIVALLLGVVALVLRSRMD